MSEGSQGLPIECTVDLVEALRLDGYPPAMVAIMWHWLRAQERGTAPASGQSREVYDQFIDYLSTPQGRRDCER